MSRIGFLWRKTKLVAMATAMWLAVYGQALAAKKKAVPEDTGGEAEGTKGWVLPYFLVLLAIGLGMLVVCRSSRRSDRAKPKQYEGLDTSGK